MGKNFKGKGRASAGGFKKRSEGGRDSGNNQNASNKKQGGGDRPRK